MSASCIIEERSEQMVITNVNSVTYNGDGTNKAWPYTFRIIKDSDINVMLTSSD